MDIQHKYGAAGGFLVGRSHKNNGIKAINKSTDQQLEMEGGEVVITEPAVSDTSLYEFEGQMLTNRQILSKINEGGGGVSFAEFGMELPKEINWYGNSYKFGGEIMSDHDIVKRIGDFSPKSILDESLEIADRILESGGPVSGAEEMDADTKREATFLMGLHLSKIAKQPTGWDINLIKNGFVTKLKRKSQSQARAALDYLTKTAEEKNVPPVFTSKHKIWELYVPAEKKNEITELVISSKNPLSSQLTRLTGDGYNDIDFENPNGSGLNTSGVIRHKKSGALFQVIQPVVSIGKDYEGLDLYKSHTGETFVDINGKGDFHTVTDEGEPLYRIVSKIVIVDSFADYDTVPKPISDISTDITKYANPYEVNRAIEKLIDRDSELTPDEKKFISYYSGYGGLEKFGATGKGILYEYFTPDEIVKKMWALAYKFGFGEIISPKVFEPSVGTGNFFRYAPENAHLSGNEINEYSLKICSILYPNAQISLQSFEQNFISKNLSIKGKTDSIEKYNLVIGNPPYGIFQSKYAGMGESGYTNASNFTEYFITRGLDLLHSGGLLIYVVGAEQYNGGTLFLDGSPSAVKKAIFEKAMLLDAYRLPTKIFERTGVASEIIVFKKR